MSDFVTYVGGPAAFLASLSYIPQVPKAWPRGSTKDLSLHMLAALTLGLGLWIVYGILRGDWVIIVANPVGTTLAAILLGCKSAICGDDHKRVKKCQRRKPATSRSQLPLAIAALSAWLRSAWPPCPRTGEQLVTGAMLAIATVAAMHMLVSAAKMRWSINGFISDGSTVVICSNGNLARADIR